MYYKGRNLFKALIFCVFIIILDASLSFERAMLEQSQSRDIMSRNLDDPPCLTLRVHNIGNIGLTVTNNGQIFLTFRPTIL